MRQQSAIVYEDGCTYLVQNIELFLFRHKVVFRLFVSSFLLSG